MLATLTTGFVQIAFYATVRQILGGALAEPGRVRIPLTGAGQSIDVTFLTIKESMGTQLALANAELIDASGFTVGVVPPLPVTIAVRK